MLRRVELNPVIEEPPITGMQFDEFGFKNNPFSITPDPRYLFLSSGHEESLAHLLYGAGPNGGFVQLTGEVGTGKTLLVRALLEQHPKDIEIAYIYNPLVSRREFLAAICDELKVPIGKPPYSIKRLQDLLTAHLLAIHACGRRTVLIVDEAQTLIPRVLETVRLLTNLETSQHKLLRIILVGQPELQDLLAMDEMRQVSQRITARFHLKPLKSGEVDAYIRHRLRIAGASEQLFSKTGSRLIYHLSGGIPRIINNICERALLALFATGKERVGISLVWQVAKEVLPPQSIRKWRLARVAAIVSLLLLPAGYVGYQAWDNSVDSLIPPSQATSAPPQEQEVVESQAPKQNPVTRVNRDESVLKAKVQALNAKFQRASYSNKQAYQDLLALWGQNLEIYSGERSPCRIIPSLGLRCLAGNATLDELIRMNRPSLLKLAGDKRLLLVAIDGDRATIEYGTGPEMISRRELDAIWSGEYVLLWRLQTSIALIGPGSQGDPVRWLRQRLALVDETVQQTTANEYDSELEQQIKRFQVSIGQKADGVVGPKTMLFLNNLQLSANTPTLDLQGKI